MTLFHRLMFYAARRIARDPEIQAKAAKVLREEIAPRAEAAWKKAEPGLTAIREQLAEDLKPAADKVAKTKEGVMARLRDGRPKA